MSPSACAPTRVYVKATSEVNKMFVNKQIEIKFYTTWMPKKQLPNLYINKDYYILRLSILTMTFEQ